MALVEPLTRIFQELIPEVTVNHIADSSLIKEVIANNQVTPAVRRRLLSYYNAAADAGADVVFNTCSSVGDVADYGNQYARIPVFRIDQPMAAEAVLNYDRIGVISTLPMFSDATSTSGTSSDTQRSASVSVDSPPVEPCTIMSVS